MRVFESFRNTFKLARNIEARNSIAFVHCLFTPFRCLVPPHHFFVSFRSAFRTTRNIGIPKFYRFWVMRCFFTPFRCLDPPRGIISRSQTLELASRHNFGYVFRVSSHFATQQVLRNPRKQNFRRKFLIAIHLRVKLLAVPVSPVL